MKSTYEDRLRFYMETEQAWTIEECQKAAKDDIEEIQRYEACLD